MDLDDFWNYSAFAKNNKVKYSCKKEAFIENQWKEKKNQVKEKRKQSEKGLKCKCNGFPLPKRIEETCHVELVEHLQFEFRVDEIPAFGCTFLVKAQRGLGTLQRLCAKQAFALCCWKSMGSFEGPVLSSVETVL
jgi:hypothetical protein